MPESFHVHHHRPSLAAAGMLVAALVLGACGSTDSADDGARGTAPDGADDTSKDTEPGDDLEPSEGGRERPEDEREAAGDGADDPAGPGDARSGGLDVAVDDGRISVLGPDGASTVVATVSEDDGELVHAVVRPGDHDAAVVLTLFRVDDEPLGVRYELRYLVVGEAGATELYWFPWRLQVDARSAEVLDVPPLPVWAPDGDALAWIEWNGTTSVLRIVGWHDEPGTNPSDATSTFRLADVEPGTQLQGWESDGGEVLSAVTPDGERLEIDLEQVELARSRADA